MFWGVVLYNRLPKKKKKWTRPLLALDISCHRISHAWREMGSASLPFMAFHNLGRFVTNLGFFPLGPTLSYPWALISTKILCMYVLYMVLCTNLDCGQYFIIRFYLHTSKFPSSLKKTKSKNKRSANTWFAFPQNSNSVTKTLFPSILSTVCCIASSPPLFYTCCLTSISIWDSGIYFNQQFFTGWLEFILTQSSRS